MPQTKPIGGDYMIKYELSEKGKLLYKNTYQTFIDRLNVNGYAATSLTGAYFGMFVRDSAIQVMAHMANGDYELCKRILSYIIGYHINIDAKYAMHIMPEVRETEIYDDGKRIYTSEQKMNADPELLGAVQLGTSGAVLRVNNDRNYVVQEFSVPFDEISSVALRYSINANTGTLSAQISEEIDGEPVAVSTINAPGKKNSIVEFFFEEPVKVIPGRKYYITFKSDGCVYGVYGNKNRREFCAYNYDKVAYGGELRKMDFSLHYIIKPNLNSKTLDEKIREDYTDHAFESDFSRYKTVEKKEVISLGFADKTVLKALLYLETKTKDGKFSVTLKKGERVIGTQSFSNAEAFGKPTLITALFPFPLWKITPEGGYELEIETEGGLKWYQDPSVRCFGSNTKPYSDKIQVDGNYMLVNAYAMYVTERPEEKDFINATYDYMALIAKSHIENPEFMKENGLLRDPNYEHSRHGRYWDSFCLCTNAFAAEGLHKMALVAEKIGKTDDAEYFAKYADTISDAIEKVLTCDFEGKKIYTELIALDENSKVYKGFSFVSITPIAADWYRMNPEIMDNTFNAYAKTANYNMFGHSCTMVLSELDENDNVTEIGDHVIGKGLAWEMYYEWKKGNIKRLDELMAFIDDSSDKTYPEVWRNNGSVADSANQEQASWLVYDIAQITGKYEYKF